MGKKLVTTLALTGALLVVPATAAFAHECIVAKRSATGAVHAAKSGNWFTITAAEGFAEFGVPAANIDDAVADWTAAGHPEAFAIFGRFTLAEGTGAHVNGATTNGKGLEHFFSGSPLFDEFAEIASNWS